MNIYPEHQMNAIKVTKKRNGQYNRNNNNMYVWVCECVFVFSIYSLLILYHFANVSSNKSKGIQQWLLLD